MKFQRKIKLPLFSYYGYPYPSSSPNTDFQWKHPKFTITWHHSQTDVKVLSVVPLSSFIKEKKKKNKEIPHTVMIDWIDCFLISIDTIFIQLIFLMLIAMLISSMVSLPFLSVQIA